MLLKDPKDADRIENSVDSDRAMCSLELFSKALNVSELSQILVSWVFTNFNKCMHQINP